MKYSYTELAKMIDHSLLHPAMTDQELDDGCRVAASYGVASVCIKPYAVRRAAEWLKNTGVAVGAVVGFPHGNSRTEVKRYETALACQDGAVEIDMVINIGKALSGDWDYVEQDIKAVCEEAHRRGAKVKVIIENDYLANGGAGLSGDDFKRRLCQISERAGADWVKTSTGYGFVKGPDGRYSYQGATDHDLRLMRAACSPKVQVKAAGGVRDLDGLIRVRDLGATRCGATATAAMLEEYKRRAAAEQAGSVHLAAVSPTTEPAGAVPGSSHVCLEPIRLFQWCPNCGRPQAARASSSPFRCASCGLVYYFNPTIAAAVFVLDAHGRVLFIRRAKEPARGKLALPGGFVDVGETVEEALRREVREEVNLELEALEYLSSYPNSYPYKGVVYPVLDFFFVARAVDSSTVRALDGVESYRWLRPAEVDLDDLAFPSMRAACERDFIRRARTQTAPAAVALAGPEKTPTCDRQQGSYT
jgi:deoxyribose-phosphate aldolase